jgi:hypothetical protein
MDQNKNKNENEIDNQNENDNFKLSETELQIKTTIYPFINDMVDTFYTENCNKLIEKCIETETDKNTFLMFIMMYFGIHLKLSSENDIQKKYQIKTILSDLIRDPEKRRICIEMFESKFHDTFTFNSTKKIKEE